jgi:hypothetical protein
MDEPEAARPGEAAEIAAEDAPVAVAQEDGVAPHHRLCQEGPGPAAL